MGVKQWLFQRLSNFIFIVFGLWLLLTLIGMGSDQSGLTTLLSSGSTQLFLTVVLLFAGINSILAGWQIVGDYAHKINVSEGPLVILCAVISFTYVLVGMRLLF